MKKIKALKALILTIIFVYNVSMKKGLVVILSGPSGVGKGSVRKILMEDSSLDLHYSVSMTTRDPRPGEINGKDYFFVTRERFDEALRNNELLEHVRLCFNYVMR